MGFFRFLLVMIFIALMGSTDVFAQEAEPRVGELQREVQELVAKTSGLNDPSLSERFLYGAFCALWAQNTRKRSWLWFVLGFAFTYICVIALLWKNAEENTIKRTLKEIRS